MLVYGLNKSQLQWLPRRGLLFLLAALMLAFVLQPLVADQDELGRNRDRVSQVSGDSSHELIVGISPAKEGREKSREISDSTPLLFSRRLDVGCLQQPQKVHCSDRSQLPVADPPPSSTLSRPPPAASV